MLFEIVASEVNTSVFFLDQVWPLLLWDFLKNPVLHPFSLPVLFSPMDGEDGHAVFPERTASTGGTRVDHRSDGHQKYVFFLYLLFFSPASPPLCVSLSGFQTPTATSSVAGADENLHLRHRIFDSRLL
jgi:hypothetical protein